MAARIERKHQWIAEAVLPQGNGPIRVLTSATRRRGKALERTAKENLRLRNASGAISSTCCNDRLKPKPEADTALIEFGGIAVDRAGLI